MMDSLVIVASCDLELDLYSKLNEFLRKGLHLLVIKVKVCSAVLPRFCMFYANTRYQMNIYRTIGPLVQKFLQPVTLELVDSDN